MKKYKIQLSIKAKEDLKNIIRYIKYKLLEPAIAERYVNLIEEEINNLKYSPQKFASIDNEIVKNRDIRKLIIKKYIVFYRINEKNSTVNIERILYTGSNWIEKI